MDVKYQDKYAWDAHPERLAGTEGPTFWIDSRSIFAGRDEVLIRHGDQTYRLRLTRFGKLILTK
jgi:hemin uptake protein HemP